MAKTSAVWHSFSAFAIRSAVRVYGKFKRSIGVLSPTLLSSARSSSTAAIDGSLN